MRDHRTDRDPTPIEISAQIRAAARRGSALRVTPPDWRIGRPPKKKTTITTKKKARRDQQAASRKRNR